MDEGGGWNVTKISHGQPEPNFNPYASPLKAENGSTIYHVTADQARMVPYDTPGDTEGYENGAYSSPGELDDAGLGNGSATPIDETTIDMDEKLKQKAEKMRLRNKLVFAGDETRRIDYILAWDDTDQEEKNNKRESFKQNLFKEGVLIEEALKDESVDGKSNFMKLSVTWRTLTQVAELLYLPKRIKMPKTLEEELQGCCTGCLGPCAVGEPFVTEEDEYFTAEFDADNMEMFDIDMNNKEDFFTNSERSLVCKEILDRTAYSKSTEDDVRYGINGLIKGGVFKAAYPLHEGTYKPVPDDPEPFTGKDKDRARLYAAWASPTRMLKYQPMDMIRKYFGEKIGIYFAWLGFYTTMLIPASIAGVAVVVYGCVTFMDYAPSNEICGSLSDVIMCPECPKICDYHKMGDGCMYAKLTYVFDNWATCAFAVFMSVWATIFLEFWKRYQKTLEYDWDVADFELEEPVRQEYEFRVKRKKKNPITLIDEPDMGWYEKIPRQCVSFIGVLFMMVLVLGSIIGVIFYRIIIVLTFYVLEPNETFARLATTCTASIINFVVIILLNFIYQKIAHWLTDLENPRTWSEFEDRYTFKMYLFQFINYYGTIIYIAFFKGSFVTSPGDTGSYLLGQYQQDTCDPSGCLVDLFIQLATVMVLKQCLNNAKELLLPKFMNCWKAKKSLKGESDSNLYMRWEQDLDLGTAPMLDLFDEYLEMVIQYGFVTIFVAAFPLAPLFALINNVIEIRLDAYKFTAVWRRGPALKAQDIGIWYGILSTITFISVVTNSFIIGYTSDFVPKMVYYFGQGEGSLEGYINSSLSFFDIAHYPADAAPEAPSMVPADGLCRYKGYYEPPGTSEEYEFTREFWVIFTARLAFIIVFEHFVFMVTYIVSAIIPDRPASVRRLQIYERELIKKLRFDATFKPDYERDMTE